MAYPILAPNSTWYKSTQSRSTITEINIENVHSGGTADETWNADADNSGAIKCYRAGTVLTIAGNGSGKIAMNADSSYLFSSASSSNRFENVTAINGAELLDASGATTFYNMFVYCEKLTAVNVSTWNTGNVENMRAMFMACFALEEIDVSEWNTSSCTTLRAMFQGAIALKELDVSKWDTSNVTSLQSIFAGHNLFGSMSLERIVGLENWNTSSATETGAMFQMCPLLVVADVSNWDTSSFTSMQDMFSGCSSLTELDVSNWDVSNVTNMLRAFYKCFALKTLDVSKWNVSKVTTFSRMFCGADYGDPAMSITDLDFSQWNTSSCTDMTSMFYGCKNLGTIDISNWDVSKVESFDHFMAHSGITLAGDGVARWVTSAAKTMDAMLYSCQNEVLDVSNFDTSNVLTFNQMFESCTKLKKIIGLENFVTSASLDFSEMFWNCISLEELNLSAFDTRNATDGADRYGRDGEKTTTMIRFFDDEINSLKRVVLGKNFSFNGDGTTTTNAAVLPTPSEGMWYNASGEGFAPADVPGYTSATYYVSEKMVSEEMLVKRGTLTRIADALRRLTGGSSEYSPGEMADRLHLLADEKFAGREYGVEWDYSQDGTTLTRLGDAALFANPAPAKTYDTVGASQFDNIMPWAGMKRYNIIDNAVAYSEDDAGFSAAYDTMVYIPQFYYKAEKDTVNSKWRWYVRSTPAPGFALHPGSGRYVGRYHASADYTSVSGALPVTNMQLSDARANSHAKGDKWWMMDIATWSAIQLLYLVEFADFDSQKTLGVGQNTTTVVNTGGTDSARYHTLCINDRVPNQYRWIENPTTNVLTMCDGFLVGTDYMAYVGTDNSAFDGTVGSLSPTGITPTVSGYINGFGYSDAFPWAFIPDTLTGAAGKYTTDYFYVASSARVSYMAAGGKNSINDRYGFWYADASSRITTVLTNVGTRLIYIP